MPAMQGGELGGQYATDRDRLAQLAQAVVGDGRYSRGIGITRFADEGMPTQAVVLVAGPGDSGLREP
jgi:hypothetical protein